MLGMCTSMVQLTNTFCLLTCCQKIIKSSTTSLAWGTTFSPIKHCSSSTLTLSYTWMWNVKIIIIIIMLEPVVQFWSLLLLVLCCLQNNQHEFCQFLIWHAFINFQHYEENSKSKEKFSIPALLDRIQHWLLCFKSITTKCLFIGCTVSLLAVCHCV